MDLLKRQERSKMNMFDYRLDVIGEEDGDNCLK